MLVIKIELHNANTDEVTELGTMIIANDGTGGLKAGNYDVRLGRKGQMDLAAVYNRPQREGKVLGHARQSYSVWALVRKALQAVGF